VERLLSGRGLSVNRGWRVCALRALVLSLIVFLPGLTALSITYFLMVNGERLTVDTPLGPELILYREANPHVERLVQDHDIETGLALHTLTELGFYFTLFFFLTVGTVFFLKEMETRTLDLGLAIPWSFLRFYNSYQDLTVLPQLIQQGFLALFTVLTFAWILLIRFYWKTFSGDMIWKSVSG